MLLGFAQVLPPTWHAKDVMGKHVHLCGHRLFVVRQGEEHIAQRAEGVEQQDIDHTGRFTQVRAAARHKTLLLLWWIDGGKWWKSASLLPDKVASGREWLCAYECEGVRILCTVAMGLLL